MALYFGWLGPRKICDDKFFLLASRVAQFSVAESVVRPPPNAGTVAVALPAAREKATIFRGELSFCFNVLLFFDNLRNSVALSAVGLIGVRGCLTSVNVSVGAAAGGR